MPNLNLAFMILFDTNRGTLWRAREDLLKETVERYDQDSDRRCHPVLSVREDSPASLEWIPMLIGSSQRRGKKSRYVTVKDVFARGTKTYFGGSPAPMPSAAFMDEAPDRDRGKLTGNPLEAKRLVVNWTKERLDEKELRELGCWMERKGLSK